MIQLSLLFSTRLYLLLSHRFCVSLLPSRRFNHLYAVPPPSSEGGEAALCAAVRAQLPLCAPSIKMCRHWRRSKAKPLRGSRGGSAADHRFTLGEHRGAKNALHRLCAKFRIPNSAFRITLCRHPFKMCAHGAHTFIFHAPKGRASYAVGVLHAPAVRFICEAKSPPKRAFCYLLTYLCKLQCLFRCRGRRAEAHRRI